jgi:CRISPR-associated protein Csx3
VDVGGRPRPWQEAIFGCCTHAILLTPDEASRETWRERIANHGLQCIADIRSDLHGESQLVKRSPVLRGTLAGLEWGTRLRGALFDALVDRLARLFAYDAQALRRAHERTAPVETVVDLGRMARALGVPHRGQQANWMPHHLPAALDYLPPGVPLGLYGRGPNWLYAALALLAYPAQVYQFDVRLGWVSPAAVRLGQPDDKAPLQVEVRAQKDHTCLEFSLPRAYIDYPAQEVRVPPVSLDRGVLLSGKLPHWLLTGIALAYRPALWLAVYQPPAGGAVVVHSPTGTPPPGSVLPKERHE